MRKPYPWPIDDMIRMYESGLCLQEIADALSSDDWQAYWIAKLGREYRPHQKVVNKAMKKHHTLRGSGAPLERNVFWRGGRTTDKGGYILVRTQNTSCRTDRRGYVREHRLVMEQKIGRQLLPTEVVHHVDGNTQNNHHSNLELFSSQAEHASVTMKGKVAASRIEPARQKVLYLRQAWWPIDLIRQWYVEDRLSQNEIARLLQKKSGSVREALRRHSIVRPNPHRHSKCENRHHEQAREFLSKFGPQP